MNLWLSLASLGFAEETTSVAIEFTINRTLSEDEETYNLAAEAMNDGQPSQCLKHLRSVSKESLHSEMFLSLGYICAISASHLKAADVMREELGMTYMPPSSLDIHHGWMLRRDKKYEEALSVLIPEGWKSEQHRKVGTTLQAILHSDLEQWTEAWLLAGSPYVEKNAKLFIAQELRLNGHISKAKSIYDQVCPEVKDAQKLGCASIINIPTDLK